MAKKKPDHDEEDGVEVVQEESGPRENKPTLARHVLPHSLPIIPVNMRPFFPKMVVPMIIENETIQRLVIEAAESGTKFVGLVLIKEIDEDEVEEPDDDRPLTAEDIHDVGVVAEIVQASQPEEGGPLQLMLGVLERFRITRVISEDPYLVAAVRYVVEEEPPRDDEVKAYSLALIQSIKDLVKLNPLHKEELSLFMSRSNLNEPGRLADFAAALTTADAEAMQEVLETVDITKRIEKVLVLLKKEMDITKLQVKINKQIEDRLSTRQREFFLNEQLKAIKKELGLSKEGHETEHEKFAERIAKLTLSEEATERINEEMEKLKLLEPSSPEFNVTRNYLEWLTSLPWGVQTKDSDDIQQASKVLDKDHYGLDDVKERILEFLSVGIMKGNMSGSIICFVGPPGVGKTSVGKSIARSIGRKFYRFSLGGARDEAEIKGHRRTYIGALPGKFIQAMKVCKSSNPVIMLDEVDKIGASYQGDPASALLEVLDPEQNSDFLDHYLDVRFDLSNVLFICTANQLDTIPRPLIDRMEVIKLAGYITQEKIQIAKKFLVPKQLKAHGLKRSQVKVTDRALREIIDGYAREPGVRGVEKHIKKIMRKAARKIVEKDAETLRVDRDDVREMIGNRFFSDETPFSKPRVGVITGLAWTSMGGDTLYIEASKITTGKASFKQTGQLGNVMVESSEIAYTYIRSYFDQSRAATEFFGRNLIHLHVPAGATPKDGPSAGVTMASALYSLALRKPIKKGFAMTGELTLTGLVMPIGGVKEKTIAAKRAGVKHIIFPAENKNDFDELPEHIRKGITPHFVKMFPEVIEVAFGRRKT
jgi:ATP-dependent Lon protease